MTPKKAMVILLILFLAVAVAFVILYINNQPAANQTIKQPVNNGDNTSASSTSQEGLTPVEQKIEAIEASTKEQVGKIVEQGKTATGGITVEAGNKIIEAETQEFMEKLKFRTPEQLKADEQRRAELEKIQQQEILQVKSQLQNK